MTRPFLIDTDTASDDAVALMMALRWPDVEVKAITIVSGNMPVEQGSTNALYTAQLCQHPAPVYIGAPRPLVRPVSYAEWFHGKDGMGNQHYPKPERVPEAQHAVDAMIETIKANPGIVLVSLGPVTNIALAVARAPEIVPLVGRYVMMGGAACTEGNVTPAAEYNIWVDPEAARLVFRSGLPIEMVGWELSRWNAAINEEEIQYLRDLNTPLAHFTVDCNRVAIEAYYEQTGERGISFPDPVAMAVALDPSLVIRSSQHLVEVETASELTRGMTVVDRLGVARNGRNHLTWNEATHLTTICWEIDIPRWKEMLYAVVR